MPKLVVMVTKDETGKLWDYSFNQAEWHKVKGFFQTEPLSIRKIDEEQNYTENKSPNPKEGEAIQIEPISLENFEKIIKKNK